MKWKCSFFFLATNEFSQLSRYEQSGKGSARAGDNSGTHFLAKLHIQAGVYSTSLTSVFLFCFCDFFELIVLIALTERALCQFAMTSAGTWQMLVMIIKSNDAAVASWSFAVRAAKCSRGRINKGRNDAPGMFTDRRWFSLHFAKNFIFTINVFVHEEMTFS